MEDDLVKQMLAVIAEGTPYADEYAKSLLKIWDFKYTRWYA